MSYQIYTSKLQFVGTDKFEIGPGRYSGEHWQDGFIFISEGYFDIAELVVSKYYSEFDWYDVNDIPVSEARKIAEDLSKISKLFQDVKIDEVAISLGSGFMWSELEREKIKDNLVDVARFCCELSGYIKKFCYGEEWICILGL